MVRLFVLVATALVGYLAGALGGGWLVAVLSSNTHDGSVEVAMTGAFVLGPLGAVAGLLLALIRTPRRPVNPQEAP
jgi:hypothetical protein